MVKLSFFHFRVTNVKLIYEKKFHKYYYSNVREPLEIDTIPYISKNLLYKSEDCPGMLKNRGGMDAVSNRWESIRCLFRGYILLGSRDIRVQSFDHVTSSNLK